MDVNQIIETLCEKFGIAWEEATKLVPEIIRWGRARGLVFLLLAGAVALVTGAVILLCLRECSRERKDYEKRVSGSCSRHGLLYFLDEGRTDLTAVFSACVIIFGFDAVAMAFAAENALQWYLAPNLAVIRYVIDLV